ncbi:hypothetical protein I79_003048 [Cricetulus griseus]|uniref:Uncharacterized protein n=1 Tax=Cricetulus griseus TaxID=10029 RepID=G3GYZ7_CRIGR|nr:hypothetical protein I79_003048 [Cricetulus griseus]
MTDFHPAFGCLWAQVRIQDCLAKVVFMYLFQDHYSRSSSEPSIAFLSSHPTYSLSPFQLCLLIKIEHYLKYYLLSQVLVAHAFNPSTWEAEAGGSL